MGKLEELLENFRNDTSWNTQNPDGTHRFDKQIAWIETMVKEYAAKLNLPIDKVVEVMEEKRDYSWPNYYQESNFPGVDSDNIIGVFNTFQEFHEHSKKNWVGFRCPRCGDISPHPQECIHRIKKDGKCDWCSFGFFKSGKGVIILEDGFKSIPIFEPVKEG